MSTKTSNQEERVIEIIPVYYDYILTQNYSVNILVGGRNSGKSYFMEQLAAINLHNIEKYKLLIVEDVETNIGGGVKDGILQRVDEFGYSELYNATKMPAEITHKTTKSTVLFKGYHSDAQQKQVKSLNEVTSAWYEEGENITRDQFNALRMQLRGGDPVDRKLYITMNPINEAGYINQEFFVKPPDKVFETFPDGRPKVFERIIKVDMDINGAQETASIPCIVTVTTHLDNPYLTKEQRADIERLKYEDPDKYEMLAQGKFVKSTGVMFGEFERHIHVVEPHIIPKSWTRYRALDYGLDMLACLWFAVSPDNRIVVYKEVHEPDMIVSEAASKIIEINNNDVIQCTYAPSDLHARTKDGGKTIFDLFYQNGIRLTDTSNRREQGWLSVKEAIKITKSRDMETGKELLIPSLQIFSNCTHLIEYFPQIKRSQKNPNDCDTQPHEITHILDALRYFCVNMFAVHQSEEKQERYIDGSYLDEFETW